MNKKIFFVLLLTAVLFLSSAVFSYALDISAESAVLLEADSNAVIFEKNSREKRPMASTTKIMTSIIAIENMELNKEITVTEKMVSVEGTSMGLLPGDKVSVYELVCGMLMSSGNDAANSIAYEMSGSLGKFSEVMNSYAKKIGMTETNFVTPSGLDDDNHFSTAYDMGLLGSYAIKNKEFLNICSAKSIRTEYGNPPYARTLKNHNKLLSMYDGSVGIKTGFTKKSGRCLVSAAEKNGITLVAVTLNASDDWNDHIKMLDYGFSVVQKRELDSTPDFTLKVVGGKKRKAVLKYAFSPNISVFEDYNPEIVRNIYLKPFEYAPVHEGQIVGTAVYCEKDTGRKILSVPIVVSEDIKIKNR